jgi:hypothetical protein
LIVINHTPPHGKFGVWKHWQNSSKQQKLRCRTGRPGIRIGRCPSLLCQEENFRCFDDFGNLSKGERAAAALFVFLPA